VFLSNFSNSQVTVRSVCYTQYIHFYAVHLDKFVVTLREMRRFGGEFVVTSHLSRTHKFAGDKLRLGREWEGRKFIAWLSWSNYEVRHSKSRGCVRLESRKEKLGLTTKCSLALGMAVYIQQWRNVELSYRDSTRRHIGVGTGQRFVMMIVRKEIGNMVNNYTTVLSTSSDKFSPKSQKEISSS